jgi:hypothetical protein
VPRHAGVAEDVADEPREQAVVLGNLGDESPRDTITAARTGRGLYPRDRGCKDVLTSLPAKLEVCTLAEFTPMTEGDLVDAGALVLARDEPYAARGVEADLVRVLFPKLATAVDSSGGLVRWLR